MAGSTPQRPGIVGKRNVSEVLERRREAEADIRPAVYVGASGLEFATVKDRDTGETYVVANPTGKTYRPGSVVFLGSNTGHKPEVLLSGPPAGFGGASVAFTVPYRTPLPAEPSVDPDGIAYFMDGSNVTASYYVGIDAGDIYGQAAESASSGDFLTFIRSDSREYVGDFSLAYAVIDENRVSCFDPIADTVYSYTPSDAYQVSGVHYANGYLWWCEGEEEQHGGSGTYATYFRLRRSNCDLTSVTTIGTFEFLNEFSSSGPEHFSMEWTQGFTLHQQMTGGLVVVANWGDAINNEIQGYLMIDWAYAGTYSYDSDGVTPSSDFTGESPYAVNDHPTYGTPMLDGAFPLTII